jgi:hypothetical protein
LLRPGDRSYYLTRHHIARFTIEKRGLTVRVYLETMHDASGTGEQSYDDDFHMGTSCSGW